MSSRTGQIRKFKTPELCQTEIDETIKDFPEIVPSIFAKIIGMKMRKKRLEKNKTQTKVAIMLDVTFQQIQKYECGMNGVPLLKIWKFCELTDTDIDIASKLGIQGIFPNAKLVSEHSISYAKEKGLFVAVWGIQNAEEVVMLKKIGISAVTSDWPDKIQEYIKSKN